MKRQDDSPPKPEDWVRDLLESVLPSQQVNLRSNSRAASDPVHMSQAATRPVLYQFAREMNASLPLLSEVLFEPGTTREEMKVLAESL